MNSLHFTFLVLFLSSVAVLSFLYTYASAEWVSIEVQADKQQMNSPAVLSCSFCTLIDFLGQEDFIGHFFLICGVTVHSWNEDIYIQLQEQHIQLQEQHAN